jgi:hypothetical protein
LAEGREKIYKKRIEIKKNYNNLNNLIKIKIKEKINNK